MYISVLCLRERVIFVFWVCFISFRMINSSSIYFLINDNVNSLQKKFITILHMYGDWAQMPWHSCVSQRPLGRSGLFLPRGSRRLSSCHQVWGQVPSPAEPPHCATLPSLWLNEISLWMCTASIFMLRTPRLILVLRRARCSLWISGCVPHVILWSQAHDAPFLEVFSRDARSCPCSPQTKQIQITPLPLYNI